ncbi:MAG TPA: hypothetical protein VGR53_06770 [Nitrososphaerales archaeon]|nr:hypothetical protein [Nitrososphaerales archaeon]
MQENSVGRAFVPIYLLGPMLRETLHILYGKSREAMVLSALLASGPLTLSALARACLAGERAIGNAGKAGWIRAILQRYRDAGILIERNRGNRITYELVESAPTVALLRELQRVVVP